MNIEINDNKKLKEAYDWCNMKYFNNELPSEIKVVWSERMTSRAGYYQRNVNRATRKVTEQIKLSSPYHRKYPEEIIDTLVHEMIHAKYPKDSHGSKFKSEMRKLNKEFGLSITVYSSGRAIVNYNYICKECGETYERTNAISEYWLYSCSQCKGKLSEVKLA